MGSAAAAPVSRSPRSHSLTVKKKDTKKLALIFPFPSLTLRDGFLDARGSGSDTCMWTATTFRQLKGSPLRALPTTPPCRVHPCSRLFHRPPVSPSALPALPDLNSPAWPEVPAYPCILVPKYPSTDAWPGPFFLLHTANVCLFPFATLFLCSSLPASPPTSLLIHSSARYSGCRRGEGR